MVLPGQPNVGKHSSLEVAPYKHSTALEASVSEHELTER